MHRAEVTRFTGALVCAAFALWAATWTLAALLTVRAERLVDRWEQRPGSFDATIARELMPRIERSIALNPLDADSHFLLARIHERLGDTALAERQYREALSRQPTWGYAWARLAGLYDARQSDDPMSVEKMSHALHQAMNLGPYELTTQRVIIPLIFKHWEKVSDTNACVVQATAILHYALRYKTNSTITLDAAKRYDKLGLIEPLIEDPAQLAKLSAYRADLQRGASNARK